MGRASIRSATVLLLATFPISIWWLVGDLSEGAGAPDRMFEAPELTSTQEFLIGLVAVVLFVVSLGFVLAALRQHRLRWAEVLPAVPFLLAGAYAGFAGRVVTARVSGANIGGGMLILLAPFVAIGTIAWAWYLTRSAKRS